MSDIVERLRSHNASLGFGGCQDCYGMVMDDAADEIERLRAQVETMSAALKPFADLAKIAHQRHRDSRPVIFGLDTAVAQRLTIGDLRWALLALPSTERQPETTTGEHSCE